MKFRVGVLMGGKSIESEVSFNSGRTVCDHLDTTRYAIIPIFQTIDGSLYILPWYFLHRGKISDFEHRLDSQAEKITWDHLKELVDFMYIAVHGRFAEDGTLQGMLEVLGIPYLGSKIFSSALTMDKIVQKSFLRAQDIIVPKDVVVMPTHIDDFEKYQENIYKKLESQNIQLPYIVKPHKEGSSLGITVVFDKKDLHKALIKAYTADPNKKQSVLIEEKIEGMEFTCIHITDYQNNSMIPLPPTEIVPEKYSHMFDYEQKYMPGRAHKFTPPRTSNKIIKKIQDTCLKTMNALGMTNISRIDGFVTKDEHVVVVDPNTLSGMAPSSFLFREAAEINMSHSQLINHLIETELYKTGQLATIIKKEQNEQNSMKKIKTRVAVLFGGNSNEREISLESGRNIIYKLSPLKYDVLPIFVNDQMELFHINQSQLVRNSTKEIASALKLEQKIFWHKLPEYVDFVFIALHGGLGENGAVQGALEMLDMPYNGSNVLTSSLCMDKYKTVEFLKTNGFDVPQSILLAKDSWQEDKKVAVESIKKNISFPLIIKPHDDGCSILVKKAVNDQELFTSLEAIFATGKHYALVEEYITGMELTVGVIGNEKPLALPPSQAIAQAGVLSIEEKFLPGAGENQTPAPLSNDALKLVQHIVKDAYELLDCKGYARIDCFYQSAEHSSTGAPRVIIIEVNSLPGMTPATCIFHQAAEIGIKPMDFIDRIIELGFEQHAMQKKVIKKTKKTSVILKDQKTISG